MRSLPKGNILPYECEFTRISCGYNVTKQKHVLSEISMKKNKFANRLKYAEHKQNPFV